MDEYTPSEVFLGPLTTICPTVNYANQMTVPAGTIWGPRIIPDCQLLYVLSGQTTVRLGPQKYTLRAGNTIFYGADSPHHIEATHTDASSFVSLHFDWDCPSFDPVHPGDGICECPESALDQHPKAYVVDLYDSGKMAFPHVIEMPGLESLFIQIAREFMFGRIGYEVIVRGMLSQLLAIILRYQANEGRSPEAHRKIAPALEAVKRQLHSSWDAKELASLCGYHPAYFATLFKEATGQSPKNYLIQERIRKAKLLLLDPGSIESVAEQLGYTSLHYFCRNFKEVTGQTPSQFRKESISL
ncbi:AraC family transcriptional regulator [Aureibacillus halotolerans]|uniref:AraC-like DNA-binding protein n=1 Tax=Aureibacillus halotolerans TaxID=1508390 RepID=A0A4R6U7P7_9BACI|nr:AraC family transcriptional regulator [Aureibacillus halotolerans]TDQ40769.1 AraC-like DNA-binding protein [Aureibacillus halotolerans]